MPRDPINHVLFAGSELGRAALRRPWHMAAAALAFALVWILFGFWSTGAAMVSIWTRSDTFAHGFLVAPISLWLVWRARGSLLATAPRPCWAALAPLAVAGACWLLGDLAAVNALAQFAFVEMLILAVVAVIGTRAAAQIAFPLAFLLFAVPIGEFLMPKLMEWTADFTVAALRLSGIPVFREGQNFVIPTGRWSVVEACSGVRYLIASLVVGTLYAYLNYRSTRVRLIFVGFSIVVPIVANWMRAYIIVMIGHLSGNKLAVGVDHLIYGWLFFGIVILLMFWIGARWRDDMVEPASRDAGVVPRAPASPAEFALVAVMVSAVALMWPLGGRVIEPKAAASVPVLTAPTLGTWSATEGPLTSWGPIFHKPPAELHETLTNADAKVGLYVAFYRDQTFDLKLVSSDNVLVSSTDRVWLRVREQLRPVDIAGQRVNVREAELKSSRGERLVVWYWYWIDGRLTASDALAKGYTALSRLMGRGDDSAVVIVYTRTDQPEKAEATLGSFLRDAGSAIEAMLSATRARR